MEKVMTNEGLWHIIEQIFGYLNYETIKTCLKVSELWNESLQKFALVKFLEEFGDRTVNYPDPNTKVSTYKEYILGWKKASQKYGIKATTEDLQEIKDALEQLIEPDGKCWGCPVHQAAKNGSVKFLDFLLSTSFNVNSRDFNGFTVFHEACKWGKIECAKLLIESSPKNDLDLNARDNDEQTAFLRACQFGRTETVKLLVESNGIDLNAQDKNGRTAFLWAYRKGHLETVKLLMESSRKWNINLNAKDKRGRTPLHWDCFNGKTETVKVLLDNWKEFGIDIKAQDNQGQTPLDLAYTRRNSIKEILEEEYAKIDDSKPVSKNQ